MNVAIIPARSGSERIPNKNVRKFCGKSMIAYSIEAAISSKYIEEVFVSTDSDKIATIARNHGAIIPFIRPKQLSDNKTPIVPVIAHAVKALMESGQEVKNACCIFPCVPLLKSELIDLAYEKMMEEHHMFSYPVVSYPHPIQRAMRMSKAGKMEFFSPEHELTRTQDLEPSFHDAGQFYWGTAKAWLSERKMHTDGVGIKIDAKKTIDIDTEEDWEKAELIKKSSDIKQ